MTALRLLVIMGSGETAPTMVKVHRLVRDRLESSATPAAGGGGGGGGAVSGVILDTPFGFQVNADDLAERAVAYFRQSVGMTMTVAGARTAEDLRGDRGAAVAAKLARSPLVFSGPGSPTYALRVWRGTLVPGLLQEKLTHGGVVVFASAAALTLGSRSVPVYEIYKVGDEPWWLPGLDILAGLGLPAVVIPHYDNAEGGTHDTRFCYLGETRLRMLEAELSGDEFVLGVDEHTAALLDLEEGSLEVAGNGGVTVRVDGRSARFESGETVSVEDISRTVARLRDTSGTAGTAGTAGATSANPGDPGTSGADRSGPSGAGAGQPAIGAPALSAGVRTGTPLLAAVRRYEAEFAAARDRRDVAEMVSSIVGLEDELWAWVADTNQSDELDRGRAAVRAMVDDLGALAKVGARDTASVIGPYVDLALALRHTARSERRFADADAVRARLVELGIEIHDTEDGSTWEVDSRS